MKYIKLYESFETDIEDILLEITDLGYEYKMGYEHTMDENNYISIVNTKDSNFNIILDCVLRLKEYLGDRYVCCYLFQVGNGWIPFDLKDGCNIKFWQFIMYLKIFYNKKPQ